MEITKEEAGLDSLCEAVVEALADNPEALEAFYKITHELMLRQMQIVKLTTRTKSYGMAISRMKRKR